MNYFKTLSKEEKTKIKKEFLSDKEKSLVYKKGNKLFILSIVGVVLSIIAGVFDYVYTKEIINYVLDGLLFIFSLVFIIKIKAIMNRDLNNYALELKDNKKAQKK
jgi:ABC-type antimicrobial peptide transport system permease subunit